MSELKGNDQCRIFLSSRGNGPLGAFLGDGSPLPCLSERPFRMTGFTVKVDTTSGSPLADVLASLVQLPDQAGEVLPFSFPGLIFGM